MIYLNLDPEPVAFGATVALTPEATVISLGEVRVGRRRFQVRRTAALRTGRATDYLLDARGNVYYLEAFDVRGIYQATSRNTSKPLTFNAEPAFFRYVDGNLVPA